MVEYELMLRRVAERELTPWRVVSDYFVHRNWVVEPPYFPVWFPDTVTYANPDGTEIALVNGANEFVLIDLERMAVLVRRSMAIPRIKYRMAYNPLKELFAGVRGDGNLFILDREGNVVHQFTAFGAKTFTDLIGVCWHTGDGEGEELYVLDSGPVQVLKGNLAGELLAETGRPYATPIVVDDETIGPFSATSFGGFSLNGMAIRGGISEPLVTPSILLCDSYGWVVEVDEAANPYGLFPCSGGGIVMNLDVTPDGHLGLSDNTLYHSLILRGTLRSLAQYAHYYQVFPFPGFTRFHPKDDRLLFCTEDRVFEVSVRGKHAYGSSTMSKVVNLFHAYWDIAVGGEYWPPVILPAFMFRGATAYLTSSGSFEVEVRVARGEASNTPFFHTEWETYGIWTLWGRFPSSAGGPGQKLELDLPRTWVRLGIRNTDTVGIRMYAGHISLEGRYP